MLTPSNQGSGRVRTIGQMLRSAFAGTIGAIVDMVVLVSLVELVGIAPAVATIASAALGAFVNFFLNRVWAFRSRGPIARQGGMYAVATAVWIALSAIVVHGCVAFIRIPYVVARIVADVAVFFGWGFPSARWIFKTRGVAEG